MAACSSSRPQVAADDRSIDVQLEVGVVAQLQRVIDRVAAGRFTKIIRALREVQCPAAILVGRVQRGLQDGMAVGRALIADLNVGQENPPLAWSCDRRQDWLAPAYSSLMGGASNHK